MEQALEIIQSNITFAPLFIFGILLLAGLNIPVSEDAMIFVTALLAGKYPEHKWILFTAVFAGAYFSDIICYFLGRTFGPKLFKIKWFAKMVKPEMVTKINLFYEKYGILTLILGRFIPFGVRNGLFLTAGLGKMSFLKFSLSDLIACTISVTFFFHLYLSMGEAVIEYVKKGNIIIFSLAAIIVLVLILKNKNNKKKLTNN